MTYKDILKSPEIFKYSNPSPLNCQINVKFFKKFIKEKPKKGQSSRKIGGHKGKTLIE